jgi:hypothetical protein
MLGEEMSEDFLGKFLQLQGLNLKRKTSIFLVEISAIFPPGPAILVIE